MMASVQARSRPTDVFQKLLAAYGKQHWWPADTPFEVMVGALLTQNTNWRNVEKAIAQLKHADLLHAASIIACPTSRLETLIRPCGYFRQKAARLQGLCRFYVRHGELAGLRNIPTDQLRQMLLELKGIGPETADSILLYALDRPIFVIDAYTRRILARLGLCPPDIGYTALQKLISEQLPEDAHLFNEFHALIVEHAKRHCRVKPDCHGCPLSQTCAHVSAPHHAS